MRVAVINILRKALAFTLLGIILLFAVSKSSYTHSHILADGTVITHAHPYDKGSDKEPFKTHHHNYFEFLIFKTFSFLNASILIFSSLIILKSYTSYFPFPENFDYSVFWRYCPGRAPPIVIS
ncbi:hypothetical protein C7377_0214 [Balneicella halophila]|uniref:Uncharacterized protein n=1 Tax=Balneicella halophila TaxID=1537566 RepID=A0A7L4UR55_BALHA|nr:hypothetical protein [Balneicella halophila]PVX51921.1 hypothetical protein C7377_0214 [Balneicella halophila]